uniref:Putative secreted protein n=1 Tax=Anopheles marajoara TaxID=58244 RepID=A0A2M4CEQ4_9DIPT
MLLLLLLLLLLERRFLRSILLPDTRTRCQDTGPLRLLPPQIIQSNAAIPGCRAPCAVLRMMVTRSFDK